eukprot:530746-Amphidinium_carterae.1
MKLAEYLGKPMKRNTTGGACSGGSLSGGASYARGRECGASFGHCHVSMFSSCLGQSSVHTGHLKNNLIDPILGLHEPSQE